MINEILYERIIQEIVPQYLHYSHNGSHSYRDLCKRFRELFRYEVSHCAGVREWSKIRRAVNVMYKISNSYPTFTWVIDNHRTILITNTLNKILRLEFAKYITPIPINFDSIKQYEFK